MPALICNFAWTLTRSVRGCSRTAAQGAFFPIRGSSTFWKNWWALEAQCVVDVFGTCLSKSVHAGCDGHSDSQKNCLGHLRNSHLHWSNQVHIPVETRLISRNMSATRPLSRAFWQHEFLRTCDMDTLRSDLLVAWLFGKAGLAGHGHSFPVVIQAPCAKKGLQMKSALVLRCIQVVSTLCRRVAKSTQ